MGLRGPKTQDTCVAGHDLNDPDNVMVVKRNRIAERQCKPCRQKRAREWWAKNRGKKAA